jgi:hypothetical protein
MTFKDIAIKNFNGNLIRYLVYYLCNSFIVAAFFMYSVLIFNKNLWTTSQIAKGVLEALAVPNAALGVFSLFFISYAHSSFIKYRKKEFGIYMNLGMTNEDIRKIIIYESIIVALSSILLGLIVGLVFSRLFFIVVISLVGARGIPYVIDIKNFIYPTIIFIGIYLVNLLTTIIVTYRFEVLKLLKADRKVQSNKVSNPFLALIGLGIVIISFVLLYWEFMKTGDRGGVLLEASIFILAGVYIFISQMGGFLIKLLKGNRKIYFKKVLFITSLNSKFTQTKKIIFIISILVAVIMFYSGHMLGLMATAEKDAVKANDYDISYAVINNKNVLSNDIIAKIFTKNNMKAKKHKILEFLYYYGDDRNPDDKIIMNDNEINKLGKINLKVRSGAYINLCQFDEMSEADKKSLGKYDIEFKSIKVNYSLYNQKNIFKSLFNNSNYSCSNIIVLNRSDYNFIKSQNKGYMPSRFQLYNFNNWKATKRIADGITKELDKVNGAKVKENLYPMYSEEIDRMLKVNSRIDSYNYNKQGAKLLLFTSCYLGIFFFIATAIVLFLKLLSDIDSDKIRFNSMYKIGITDEEAKKQIGSQLKPLFFIGPVIGIILAFSYTVVFCQDNPSNMKEAMQSNVIVSLVFLFIQTAYYFICKKIYCDKVSKSIKKGG